MVSLKDEELVVGKLYKHQKGSIYRLRELYTSLHR